MRFMMALVAIFSGYALGLGETNCSNAQASLRRVEKEIWGANLVTFIVHGEEFQEEDLDIKVAPGSKRVLERRVANTGGHETAAFKVEVSRRDGKPFRTEGSQEVLKVVDNVLCYTWWNNAID